MNEMSPVSPNPRRGGPVKQRYFAGAKSAAMLLSVPVRWRSRGADWRGDLIDRVPTGSVDPGTGTLRNASEEDR